MARTTKKSALPMSGLHMLPLALIDESPTNPRKTFDPVELQDLADSISVDGVHQPVIARVKGDRLELICGARRFRASKLAGRSDIPVIVRDLDDVAALELQLEENNQRRDVTDVEEAEAIVMLHETYGRSISEVASHLGRSVPFVRSRVELGKAAPAVKALLADGLVRVGGALMLSRAPVNAIDELAERVRAEATRFGVVKERDLGRFVGEFARLLDSAPFDRDDASLTGRGACSKCPDRTGAQIAMFENCSGTTDRCLDVECWDRKVEATWERAKKDAKKRGLPVLNGTEKDWGKTHVAANQNAWRVGFGEKTFRQLVGEEGLVIARDFQGHVCELVVLEAAKKAAEALEDAGSGADGDEGEGEDSNEGQHEHANNRFAIAADRRKLEEANDRQPILAKLQDVPPATLLLWILGKVQYPRDLALGRGVLEPGEAHGASVAQLTAWGETAGVQNILIALVEDAWLAGVLDDEATLDGLISAQDADEDGEAAQ